MANHRDVMARIAKIAHEAEERNSKRASIEKECESNPSLLNDLVAELNQDNQIKKRSSVTSRKLVEAANDQLSQCEQLGLFSSFPVADKNSIPTFLARLPIFLPIPASKQKELLDADMAYKFNTPFGRGRRFGPPVTIDDEDVLFALLILSEKRLIGQGGKLPIPLSNADWLKDQKGNLTVQIVAATIGMINKEIGLSKGGKNYRTTLASIKRLCQVGIEIETKKRDLYLGENWSGENVRLLDVRWKSYKEDGLILGQFSPLMVKWLKEQATYFNWTIRKQIKTAHGRALHRFLSTQGNSYKQELNYIADAIGWDDNRKRLKPRMEVTLKQLRDEFEWCDYEITGTGRASPFVLEFYRRKK